MTLTSTTGTRFDPITLEILWSRLNGVTEEMWNTILRTSFSTLIGAALDYGCALLDAKGGQLTHASGSMPGFNLALPTITRDLIRRFEGRIYPGDVFIGNDPWLCCGHLPDVAIMTPVFRGDRLVAFTCSVGHQADWGGAHGHKRVREVYEEGIFVPVSKLYERDQPNATLFEYLRANIRVPDMVMGDLEAQVSANQVGARRLLAVMDEYGLDDPTALVDELQQRSESAMRDVIRALPDGSYRIEGWVDGLTEPLRMVVEVNVQGDEMLVDYTGTADQLESGGINCTLSYTTAETHYALKCVLAPHIPHNEGSSRPLKVSAPVGSLLNCTFPASVNMRTRTGWHLHSFICGALAPLVPDRVVAGPGMLQNIRIVGRDQDGKGYNAPMFAGGGRGGSASGDGIGGFIFPSSASSVSIEVMEISAPALIVIKEWEADTAGPGKFRGGPAQRIRVRRLPGYDLPVRVHYAAHRLRIPAPGFLGGQDGRLASATWNGQPVLETELGRDGWTSFRADTDELSYLVASGGGFGDPRERDPANVEADLKSGLVSPEGAISDYNYRAP